MSPFTFDNNDMISASSVTVPIPLHLLVTLGLCGLALLGKAFFAICHVRAARDVGTVYAGSKEPLPPPPPVAAPAQPPPVRQPKGPQRAYSSIEQWLERLIVTADGCLDESNNFQNSSEDVKASEGPSVVASANDAVSRAPAVQRLKQKRKEKKQRHRHNKQARRVEQQSASKETSQLLDRSLNSSDNTLAVTKSVSVVERYVEEDTSSNHDSSVVANAAYDEISVVDEEPHVILQDTVAAACMAAAIESSQPPAGRESTTTSPNTREAEPEVAPLRKLLQDISSLKAFCRPEQGSPSYDVFTRLRSVAIASTESHSQDFANLADAQKHEVFEDTLVYAMLKVIAASQMPQSVVDKQHEPVAEQTTRSPDDVEGDSLEAGNTAHEQLAETIPEESVTPSASSSLDHITEAAEDPLIPVEPSASSQHTEEIRDDRWKCGFSWSDDVEEEEERRRQEEQERRQQEDGKRRQLEALRRSPTTLARLQQTLARITEEDEEHS